MSSKDKEFNDFITNYQPHLIRIVGKHRRPNHHLTSDEIISEVNVELLKNQEGIQEKCADGSQTSEERQVVFRKLAYSYVRNIISWRQWAISDSNAVKKRLDILHHTAEGVKSTFEVVSESYGEKDDSIEEWDSLAKMKHILRMVRSYSCLLTERELLVLRWYETGKLQEEIADRLGVTHQAISVMFSGICNKIQHSLNVDFSCDDTAHKVTAGHEAVASLFSPDGLREFCDADRAELVLLVVNNRGEYTPKELTKLFRRGAYTEQQVLGYLRSQKLAHLLKTNERWPPHKEEEIISLVEEGFSVNQISKIMKESSSAIGIKCSYLLKRKKISRRPLLYSGRGSEEQHYEMLALFKEGLTPLEVSKRLTLPYHFVAGKRSGFTSKGELPPVGRPKKFSPEREVEILEMFKNNESAKSIAKKLDLPTRSIAIKRGSYVKQGLLEPLPRP